MLIDELNARPMKRLGGKTRRELFEALDQPALKPLPDAPFVCAEWLRATVHGDYRVEVDRHYYSVPHLLSGEEVDVRLSPTAVEIFDKGNRVASHARSHEAHKAHDAA